MNIGTQIQKIRRKNNISQGQFAKDCGITQTYLSLIEAEFNLQMQQNSD